MLLLSKLTFLWMVSFLGLVALFFNPWWVYDRDSMVIFFAARPLERDLSIVPRFDPPLLALMLPRLVYRLLCRFEPCFLTPAFVASPLNWWLMMGCYFRKLCWLRLICCLCAILTCDESRMEFWLSESSNCCLS